MKKLLLGFLLLVAVKAQAAPAYVGSSFTCLDTAGTTVTFSSVVVSAGQTLVVGVGINTGGATQISTIAFNTSESFTSFNEIYEGTVIRGELWGLLAPTATTADVVVTSNAGGAPFQACLAKFTGVGSFGTSVEGASVSGTPTVTCSSAAGQLVVDVSAQYAVEAVGAAGAGQTAAGSNTTAGGIGTAMSYENGSASVVMSWVNTLNPWANVCVSLVPPASASTAGSMLRRRRN